MKKDIKRIVEDHISQKATLVDDDIVIQNPIALMSPQRLDLGFKLFYLNYRVKLSKLSDNLYKKTIEIITNFSFQEFGNDKKNSYPTFIDQFKQIENSILSNGFDYHESVIPVSQDNIILDGSHRLCSCIKNNIEVPTIKYESRTPNYNWVFFRDRGMGLKQIELGVTEYINYSNDIYIAFLWPVAKEKVQVLKDIIGNDKILYLKKVKFETSGALNLIAQIYHDQKWLGTLETEYNGAISKLSSTFDSSGITHIILFQSDNILKVNSIKDKFRDQVGMGKHSVHINDSKDELISASQLVLNENSISFLNNSNILKYKDNFKKIEHFKKVLVENKISFNDIVVGGSLPLSLYGYLEPSDIDFLSTVIDKDLDIKICSHNSYEKFYKKSIDELVYNPDNYFYFNGIKFLKLEVLVEFKRNRNEIKDKLFLENYKSKSSLRLFFYYMLNNLSLLRYKVLALIIKYSKILGIYDFLKFFYKKLFK